MKIAIVCSKKIKENFKVDYQSELKKQNIKFIEINDYPHYLKDKQIKADYIIVLGIHSLKDHPKILSVHPIGNWQNIWKNKYGDLGGEKGKLSMSSGNFLKFVYLSLLKKNTQKKYKVCIECTHHGPSISTPILSLEIGTTTKEWKDKKAIKTIIKVVKDIMKKFSPKNKETCIVLGGNHYMENPAKLLKNSNYIISHFCPTNKLTKFTDKNLKEAIKKSEEKITKILLNLPKTSKYNSKLINLAKKNNLGHIYIKDLL